MTISKHRRRRPLRPSVGRRLLVTILALGVVMTLTASVALWWYARVLEAVVVEKFTGRRWALPSRVYSDSFLIYPGLNLKQCGFYDRLSRLNYREVSTEPLRKGDFRRQGNRLDLYLRDFTYPARHEPGKLLHVLLDGDTVTHLRDDRGAELVSEQLEPEIITGFYETTWEERQVVALDQVPQLLIRAIVITEDRRFFEHHGIDPIGILRAIVANLIHGEIVQGGSTLTQQLTKNFFLTEERTFSRKFREALMALITERRYSKEEILENYLNEIYLGQSGLQGIFGIWEASQFYFARPPHELSLAEMATLAALIKAPNRYSPYRHPERAKARRDLVLKSMLDAGEINAEQYAAAVAEPLRTTPVHQRGNAAPYYVDFLREELTRHYPAEVLTSEGLRIFTTLDPQLQRAAEKAVREGLTELERAYPALVKDRDKPPLQAALIALQPQTGEIKAMVGGRDYASSQFNRVLQARRQTGSVFKPLVYLAAFEHLREREEPLEPTAMLEDAPFEWKYENRTWTPKNYRDRYLGEVTVRRALELSLNAATARLAHRVGIEPIRELAHRMGIAGPLPLYPSMVLGALEASPFEIAHAYSAFANLGTRAEPRSVRTVVDRNGLPIERRPVAIQRVVSPEAAFMVTHLMQGVFDRGTAESARARGFKRIAAGKTGTTNDERDAWFAGFTADLLAVVWVGFDDNRPLRLTGAHAALPIWTAFMKEATAARPDAPFLPPPGIALVEVDPYTGGVATPACPDRREEAFWRGHEPTTLCPVHGAT